MPDNITSSTPSCFDLTFNAYDINSTNTYLLRPEFDQIATVNSEFIIAYHEENKFRSVIEQSICTMDGQIPLWLAKIFGRHCGKLTKVTGSAYIKEVIKLSEAHNLKLFLLGGKPSSIERILKNTNRPELIDGFSPELAPYPFEKQHNDSIKEKLINSKPDIVLVGFGAKKQEYWIYDNKDFLQSIGVRTAIGVGGSFEMLSGNVTRAPTLVHKLGLESIHRLLQEPSLFRLKRILKSFAVFKYIF